MENEWEKLVIEPWGRNSFRVRSRMMGEIMDTDFALLPSEQVDAQIEISRMKQP